MLIVGALALAYAFCYATGALSALGYALDKNNFTVDNVKYKYDMGIILDGSSSLKLIEDGKWDATLYTAIQSFNDLLMYFGIAMVVLAVVLYITACNSRRKYYVTNYVATGLCVGGNIVMSAVAIVMNIMWRAEFLNVDFEAWKIFNDSLTEPSPYSTSTLWFDIGFAVYALVIIASLLLVFNLVWKVLLMKGEKKLLNASATIEEGAAV